jgi:hypothetical protein
VLADRGSATRAPRWLSSPAFGAEGEDLALALAHESPGVVVAELSRTRTPCRARVERGMAPRRRVDRPYQVLTVEGEAAQRGMPRPYVGLGEPERHQIGEALTQFEVVKEPEGRPRADKRCMRAGAGVALKCLLGRAVRAVLIPPGSRTESPLRIRGPCSAPLRRSLRTPARPRLRWPRRPARRQDATHERKALAFGPAARRRPRWRPREISTVTPSSARRCMSAVRVAASANKGARGPADDSATVSPVCADVLRSG